MAEKQQKSEKQKQFAQYFKGKMEQFDTNNIEDLGTEEKKKEFFKSVDTGWDGMKESKKINAIKSLLEKLSGKKVVLKESDGEDDDDGINKVKVSMVMLSHLSDLQEGSEHMDMKINFIKYLIFNFKDTNTLIDPKAEFKKFKQFGKNKES